MKSLVLSIALAIAFVAGSSSNASAEVEIMTWNNVSELTIHVTNEDGRSWKKTLPFNRPTSLVLKPCVDKATSNCLYTVGRRGEETEHWSFSGMSWYASPKHGTLVAKKTPKVIKVARR